MFQSGFLKKSEELLSGSGMRIVEVPIKNIERPHGASNYGISRTFSVVFDLMTLKFLLGYVSRPLHFFGKAALYSFLISFALSAYVLFDKIFYRVPIFEAHGPLTFLAGVLLLISFGFVSTGLIGELVSRVYFESSRHKIYTVRNIHRKG